MGDGGTTGVGDGVETGGVEIDGAEVGGGLEICGVGMEEGGGTGTGATICAKDKNDKTVSMSELVRP